MRGGNSDEFCRCQVCLGKDTLLGDEENPRLAMFERRLPFFGCGIGWCCFLLGFMCPLIWYIAALLYCCKYYNRDPRERPGLCASAFLAIIFTAVTIVTLFVLLIICEHKRFLNGCGSGLKIHNSWLQDIRCISMTNGVLDRNTI
ncbi:uncharacterized protein [Lolium perenne]|uniref:uncharacterized protein isoform X3 n=1 Tax=Lolium perenne TaxID=4522 RepID=UPI0021F5CDFD|nr:uncharacterized protein LOC127295010 isoform X3 [Lolium perenne]